MRLWNNIAGARLDGNWTRHRLPISLHKYFLNSTISKVKLFYIEVFFYKYWSHVGGSYLPLADFAKRKQNTNAMILFSSYFLQRKIVIWLNYCTISFGKRQNRQRQNRQRQNRQRQSVNNVMRTGLQEWHYNASVANFLFRLCDKCTTETLKWPLTMPMVDTAK